jgi:hypothetical protein
MDAESQQIKDAKREVIATTLQVETYEVALRELMEHNRAKNQIIRELMAWIDAEFRLDSYPLDSPGKKLWDRAEKAIR